MKRDKFFQLYGLDEKSYSNRGLLLIVYLYFGSLLFASIIAPLIFNLVHFLDPESQSYLANKPFTDYFDRSRLLCLAILFPYLMKKANLWSWTRLGYLSHGLDHFKRWFPVGIGMMIIVYLIDFGFGVLEPRDNWTIGYQAQKIGLGLIGALLIGFMEETFFRGFVFRTFYSVMRPAFAVVFSSLFFAYLHFKMADEVMAHIPTSEIGIDDGLFAIWGSVTAFTTGFDAVLFFNLALVGVLLHLAFLYTRNLWACVGLHAGWVFVIQSLVKTIDETEDAHAFFGTEKVADGYLVSFFLVGFVLLFMWLIRTRNSQSSILV